VGSFSRGDEEVDSDIDLFVLVKEIDFELLKTVGNIVQEIKSKNEINPAIISETEFLNHTELFDLPRIQHEGIPLFGQLLDIIVPDGSELNVAKRIAAEVLMGSRHYLAVAEPVEKFAGGKLWTWILKPLSFALRYYHFHNTGYFVRKFDELAQEFPILNLDSVDDCLRIIEESIIICEKIINT
jgi:hypothetical protein